MSPDFNFTVMKSSIYNYIMYDETFSYWYNGLTHQYFLLPKTVGEKIEKLLHTSSSILQLPDSFREKLYSGGFIIDEDVNELDVILNENVKAVNKKDYFLVILPTLNCNFKCWYCIQDHIPSVMSEDTVALVKNHIKYVVENLGIETLHIEWFGGEPFLYFNKVIKPISEYAISVCQKAGIPFFNSATTNGYYLTDKTQSMLDTLNFKRFQITLDGNREFHDKVKYQKGCASAFEHVLTNINNILSVNKSIEIILRINYTHSNLTFDIVDQVNTFINLSNRDHVIITPKKVWQETIDKGSYINRSELLNRFEQNGYRVSWLDAITNFIPCYASKKYYCAINYNGTTVKCTACDDLYDKQAKGHILKSGQVKWEDNFEQKYSQPSFMNEKCLRCKYLPICLGVCPRDFVKGISYCKIENQDSEIEQSLINYIKHSYNQNNP